MKNIGKIRYFMYFKKQIIIFSTILLFIFISCDISNKNKDAVITLKLATELSENHPTSIALKSWGKKLKKTVNSKIEIKFYFAGDAGDASEIIDYTQEGILDIGLVSTDFLSEFDERYGMLSLPYVFRDKTHMYSALNSKFGEMMKNLLVEDGIRILCFPDAGSRNIFTTSKNINSPKDLIGVKIRVIGDVAIDTMTSFGSSCVPIPWSDLYTSLRIGIVNAAEDDPSSILSGRLYEVCKYISMTGHFRIPDALIINESTYKRIPSDIRKLFLDSINKIFIPTQNDEYVSRGIKDIATLRKKGMKINIISDLTPFITLTDPIRQRGVEKLNMKEWYDIINQM